MKILLDTNFIILSLKHHIDIFEELTRIIDDKYQVFVLKKTIDELKNLYEKKKGKEKTEMKISLQFVTPLLNNKIKVLDLDGYADRLLIELGADYVIATNDREIQEQVSQYIFIRQEKYFATNF